MRFGYSTSAVNPVLHMFEGDRFDNERQTPVWRCGQPGMNGVVVDNPTGIRPCKRCLAVGAVPVESVYFLERDGLIKIGYSINPRARAGHFAAALLATIPGDGRTERALHLVFADQRVTGEWFNPSPDLLALIERAAVDELAAQ